MEHVLIHHLK